MCAWQRVAELTTEKARALVRRFGISFETDVLARKFRTMSKERQERLFAFFLALRDGPDVSLEFVRMHSTQQLNWRRYGSRT